MKGTRLAELIATAFDGQPKDFPVGAQIGAFTFDLDSGELYWSPEIYRILGLPEGPEYRREGLALSLCLPESAKPFSDAVHAAKTSGQAFDLKLRMRHADGGAVEVRVTAAVRFKHGAPWLMSGTFVAREPIRELRRRAGGGGQVRGR